MSASNDAATCLWVSCRRVGPVNSWKCAAELKPCALQLCTPVSRRFEARLGLFKRVQLVPGAAQGWRGSNHHGKADQPSQLQPSTPARWCDARGPRRIACSGSWPGAGAGPALLLTKIRVVHHAWCERRARSRPHLRGDERTRSGWEAHAKWARPLHVGGVSVLLLTELSIRWAWVWVLPCRVGAAGNSPPASAPLSPDWGDAEMYAPCMLCCTWQLYHIKVRYAATACPTPAA